MFTAVCEDEKISRSCYLTWDEPQKPIRHRHISTTSRFYLPEYGATIDVTLQNVVEGPTPIAEGVTYRITIEEVA